ncbi:MAG: Si-specific NAD(P)(+) transhydrogenase [Planctomycetota bacterium]
MSEHFDLVVIGAGPAGEKGAAQAAYFGKRVAIVERAPEPGGAGVHTGTLPSKTLRETALFLSGFAARELYGVTLTFVERHAAVPTLIARKDAMAAAEVGRMRRNLERHGVTYVQGDARFTSPHEVEVTGPAGERHLRAEVFLIATGSSPRRPPELPWDDPALHDSDGILQLDALPDSLTILGAGVIGCEYACMFAALGVAVTLIEPRDEVLPFLDVDVGARLRASMQHLGIDLRVGRGWQGVARQGQALVTTLADGTEIAADRVLLAAGRSGNTDGLGLAALGLAANARGQLTVDANYRTAVPHVFAAGDVIGFPALASVSMEQARVAMCHAFDLGYKSAVHPTFPYGIYTIPEASCVGETEQSCQAAGVHYVVGRAEHEDNARGRITGDREGLTKLVVHRETRKLLGVHVVGERASEHVHIGQAVLNLGGTVDAFIDMVFNHPTLAETYKYAAYDALGKLARG